MNYSVQKINMDALVSRAIYCSPDAIYAVMSQQTRLAAEAEASAFVFSRADPVKTKMCGLTVVIDNSLKFGEVKFLKEVTR